MRNRTSFLLLYFLLMCFCTKAQLTSSDSLNLKHYKNKIVEYTSINLDTAILLTDSLINYARRFNSPEHEIEGMLEKIGLGFYKGDNVLIAATIEEAEHLIAQYKLSLGDRIKKHEHLLKMHSANHSISIGQLDRGEILYKSLADELELMVKGKKEKNLLIICYINLGGILRQKGSYHPALAYYHKAINLQTPFNRTNNYIYIANIYATLGKTKETIEYAKKAIENLKIKFEKKKNKKRDALLVTAFYTLVDAYLIEANYEDALASLTESLNYQLKDDPLLPTAYERFGRTYARLKKYDLAISYYRKALDLKKQIQKTAVHFNYANPNKYIGDTYLLQGAYEQALTQYQLAITHIVKSFQEKDYRKNPSLAQVDFKKELLILLSKKSNCFYQLTLHGAKQEYYALLTQQTTERAMHLIDSSRLNYTVDADKQFLLEQSYAVYEIGIDLAMHQGDVERAFTLAEQSKAMVLAEGINRKKAQLLTNMTSEERVRLRKIEKDISVCNSKLQAATDEVEIAQLRDEKFALNNAHRKFMAQLATDETFKAVVAQDHHYSLPAIKAGLQDRGVGMLEFFEGEQAIFAFYLDVEKNALRANKIEKTQALQRALKTLGTNVVSRKDTLYFAQARLIYQELLAPLWQSNLPKRLVIIPDGVLGSIPYHVLLTEDIAASELEDFSALPYLFYQTSLSMAFSAGTLLNQDLRLESPSEQAQLIAYAPSFRGQDAYNKRGLYAQVDRNGLSDLVFNKEEVNSLEKKFVCHKIMNEAATKRHFLEHAEAYRNAHIAAHAKVNINNSDRSFIAFSDVLDTTDYNYKLTVDELYGLSLPMDMVVLSACETGLGQAVKGEGIISIARGFAYAGVRSIVTTLWNVNDLSTSVLVEHFYQRLDQREPKDIALQNSMKDYLKNPQIDLRHKHPKYWAAFTVIGHTEAIVLAHPTNWKLYLGLAAALLLSIALFIWQKKYSSTK